MKVGDAAITTSIVTQINKFPRVESQHCIKSSTQEYHSEELNLNEMFDLHEVENTLGPIKRKITNYILFVKYMNLYFQHLKKD